MIVQRTSLKLGTDRRTGRNSRPFLAALMGAILVEWIVGFYDAVSFSLDYGSPGKTFPLLVLLVYSFAGLLFGTIAGLLNRVIGGSARLAAALGVGIAFFASGIPILFREILPSELEMGSIVGLIILSAFLGTTVFVGWLIHRATPTIGKVIRPSTVSCFALLAAIGTAGLPAVSTRTSHPLESLGPPPVGFTNNVILMVLDTTRADRLGSYGGQRNLTPNLDSLAARGITFTRSLSVASYTNPSHASLLTGNYPSRHGVQNPNRILVSENETVAEIFADKGIASVGVVANLQLIPDFGWKQGFQIYDASPVFDARNWLDFTPFIVPFSKFQLPVREFFVDVAKKLRIDDFFMGRKTAAKTLNAIDIVKQRPFFAFMNFMDPHYPYTPPSEWELGLAADVNYGLVPNVWTEGHPLEVGNGPELLPYMEELYEREIACLDAEIGNFVEKLDKRGLLTNTTLIITSDHGEHLGEHGLLFHTNSLYKENLDVPLIIVPPNSWHDVNKGSSVDVPVSSVDVAATMLDVMGVPVPQDMHGKSLRPFLFRDRPVAEQGDMETYVVAEDMEERVLVWKHYKAFFKDDKLLQVVSDAQDETEDLSKINPHLAQKAQELFDHWYQNAAADGPVGEAEPELSEHLKKALSSIGYAQ